MKAKKWLAAILLCAIIVTAFCGCGAKSQPQTDISPQSSISSQETVETVETVKKEEKPASMPSDVDKKESSSKSADTSSVNSDSDMSLETISAPDRVNLTNMAENIIEDSPVFINYVIHKAYIEVYEQGTKAAAVTAIGGTTTTSIEMSYSVTLDRPFLFAIYDCQEHLPLFTGVVKNFEKE